MKDSLQPHHFRMSPIVDQILPSQQIDGMQSEEDVLNKVEPFKRDDNTAEDVEPTCTLEQLVKQN